MKTTEATSDTRRYLSLLLAALVFTSTPTRGDSTATALLQQLQVAHPGTRFTEVTATPVAGLYQVQMQANHAYVMAAAPRYFLFGTLFDTQTLTEIGQRTVSVDTKVSASLPTIAFDDLPLADAIKTVRGNRQHRLAVFSDPACPYCRQLQHQLDRLDDVTLYTFPLAYLGEDLPRSIWCAADPAEAWQRQMQATGTEHPTQVDNCDNPLQRTMELARRLGIQATPTLIYADGGRSSGLVDFDTLRRRVTASTSADDLPTAQAAGAQP